MNSETARSAKEAYEYPRRIRASYGSRELFGQWISAAFGFSVLFFYKQVIGLNALYVALAYVIYSLWNAFNDPLVGWIMEKVHMPWEKKRGLKRFPWMIIAVVPYLFSFVLIFMVPSGWDPETNSAYQLPVFFWYLGTICLYDTLLTIYDVNVVSLYPDKFRSNSERRSVQGYGTILGILGLVLAAIVPPLVQNKDVPSSYVFSAFISFIVGIVLFLLVIPGIREDQKTRERYQQRKQLEEHEKVESFLKSLKSAVNDRTFMMKVLFFFGYQVGGVMLQTSGFFITTFILDLAEDAFTYLLGGMLLGALISVPLWTILSHRVNDNKKMSVIAGIMMTVTFIPLIFMKGLIGWIISLLFFGIGLGGQWFVNPPTMGDVLDDIAVRTKKRQQSIFYGVQAFFIRAGQSFIAITIALVQILTGLPEGVTSLVELQSVNPGGWQIAVFGVHIHSAVVPAILVLITTILFWKYYDITPEKVLKNKERLKELKL
ncbi:MAG: MFS transporter [Promethearchaeota archaeon]|jgi:GPH family glycoside/pentoside/hexuronide:cation symporter